MTALSPDWFGSPQHIVAGAVLAAVLCALARRRMALLAAAAMAVSMTMAAEALVELVEWPLLYGSTADASAYYDTIADIGATLLGAVVGTPVGFLTRSRR